MNKLKKYKVIGIMSGTSMDGIDCSYINTDGKEYFSIICEKSYPYSLNYKNKLKKLVKIIKNKRIKKNDQNFVTNKFILLINKFIKEHNIERKEIDFVGFSGQTILHDPANKISIQIGSCKNIQKKIKNTLIGNFRKNDLINGGTGAPIGAFFYKIILKKFHKKSALLNIGGVSNITYIKNNKLIAFDVGPGNSLIDDLMFKMFDKSFDKDGKIAFKGKVNKLIIKNFLKDQFFKLHYPKSLDREYFSKYLIDLKRIKKEDAITTASMLSIKSIILTIDKMNINIKYLILTGGGRKNNYIFKKLKYYLSKKNIRLLNIDKYQINGDMLESQAFAYLAVRSYLKLPISIPTTTGVKKPISGGEIFYNF